MKSLTEFRALRGSGGLGFKSLIRVEGSTFVVYDGAGVE